MKEVVFRKEYPLSNGYVRVFTLERCKGHEMNLGGCYTKFNGYVGHVHDERRIACNGYTKSIHECHKDLSIGFVVMSMEGRRRSRSTDQEATDEFWYQVKEYVPEQKESN